MGSASLRFGRSPPSRGVCALPRRSVSPLLRPDELAPEPGAPSKQVPLPDLRQDYDADLEGPAIDGRVVVQKMLHHSLAFFASEVVRGNVTSTLETSVADQFSDRTYVAEFHEEWCEIVQKYALACLQAPRDSGKCTPAGHLILRSDGARIPIEEWHGGEVFAFDPKTYSLARAQATAVHRNGVKRCLKIRTRTGREVTVTENHPLRTLHEWRRADLLSVGDRVAVPREIAIDGDRPVQDAWLLGVLVGDGGLTQNQVRFTSIDAGIVGAVQKICEERGWTFRGSDDDWFLGNRYVRKNSPLEWTRAHGLQGKDAYEKRVPNALFVAPRADIAEFVAGLMDTDGHVSAHLGGSVEFYSVSKLLLHDVQHLLIRLGVVSVLALKNGRYNGANHKSWRLTVRGRSILRFAEWVRLRSEQKSYVLAQITAEQRGKDEGGSIDLLPTEVYSKLKHGSDWFRNRGFPRYARHYSLTRTKALALADAEDNEDLRTLAEAEILWDEVVAIEDAGLQETYFITVPGLESYVGDDIVQHNSHLLTIALPIWEAWRRPGCEICIFSETQPQAEERLSKVKLEIENNPRLSHLRDPNCWSATKIRLTTGSVIYARGFGVKVRGMHPHLIILDDVVSEQAMYSELIRQRQWTYYSGAVRQMLVPGGRIVCVGTPQHSDDLYARFEQNSEWFFKRYTALDESTGQPLFPQRYTLDRLLARKAEIGEIQFAREFLCRSISTGMSMFPDEFFNSAPFKQHMYKLGSKLADGRPARTWWHSKGIRRFYIGVDISTAVNVKGDWFVVFVVGLDDYGNRWIVDIIREHGLGYEEQKATIVETAKLWRADLTCIEGNAAQSIYGQEIRKETDIAVHLHFTGSEKHDLQKGIPGMRLLFEGQKYRAPRGDDESIVLTDIFIGEMQAWTFSKIKGVVSVAKYDDVAMAAYMCEKAIEEGEAFAFAMGEQPGDAAAAEELRKEEEALLKELDEKGLDPWGSAAVDIGNLSTTNGRSALDFGDGSAQGFGHGDRNRERGQNQNAHGGELAEHEGPPQHPLGSGVPLANLFGPRRFVN